jgi:hypothetical protein
VHNVIARALEYELIHASYTADSYVEKIFERIHQVLVPHMLWREYELLVADIQHDAEKELSRFAALDVDMTVDAIADALHEAKQKATNQTNQTGQCNDK